MNSITCLEFLQAALARGYVRRPEPIYEAWVYAQGPQIGASLSDSLRAMETVAGWIGRARNRKFQIANLKY